MTDEEAYLELVRSNNQGELSPLEIGIHALEFVPLSNGGRGKSGGLSEYARAIGRRQQTISDLRNAASIYQKLTDQSVGFDLMELQSKSTHLAAIAKSPESDWQWLTELMLSKEWSVRETEAAVSAVKQIDIPAHFNHWLEPLKWKKTSAIDAANDPNSDTHQRLVRWITTAQECLDSLPNDRGIGNSVLSKTP